MTLATHDKQLTLIYTPDSTIGKQALAYVKGSGFKFRIINISEASLTGTQWSEISDLLDTNIDGLVAKDHPDISRLVKDSKMSSDHWIKFIQNNPIALQQPILLLGKKALQIKSPSEVMKFISVDSAGLEKHPIGNSPETSKSTQGETQV